MVTAGLLTLPLVTPLAAAAVLLLLPRRRWADRLLGVGASLGVLAVGVGLLSWTLRGGRVLSDAIGGWLPGVSIVLAVDPFSAMMLCVTALLVALCVGYADTTDVARHRLFTPLAL